MSQFDWESSSDPPEFEDESSYEQAVPASGISNQWLGVWLFMVVEAMLFLIFIFAFIFIRGQGQKWPPPGVPALDIRFATINSLVLILSAFLVFSAERFIKRYLITQAEKLLLFAIGLGILFLAGQIREYAVLFSNGITTASGLYGALFYVTIAFHGLHVLSGLVWLGIVWNWTREARQTPDRHFAVQAATLYWGFVATVWLVLFLLLYVL